MEILVALELLPDQGRADHLASRSIRLPSACFGNTTPAIAVIASDSQPVISVSATEERWQDEFFQHDVSPVFSSLRAKRSNPCSGKFGLLVASLLAMTVNFKPMQRATTRSIAFDAIKE